MHKLALVFPVDRAVAPDGRRGRPHLSARHIVRPAVSADLGDIHELVESNAARGLVLPRSAAELGLALDDYVVVTDRNDHVLAAAALMEYSPSLAEVGSVVVADAAQGQGLGTMAVRGVEAMARRRGYDELFALTTADRFFETLGYRRTALDRYPEKIARYEALAARGIEIRPKSCFRKLIGSPQG